VARFAEVVTQTFRNLTPEAISERLFGDSLDSWWSDYQQSLEATVYKGPVQVAFFIATFAAMGRLCKSDGRVREAEIQIAGSVMDHLGLNQQQKRIAIRLFNEGKQGDFDVEAVLGRFYRIARHRPSVLQIFIEIQLQAAIADAPLNDLEEALLLRMCKRLDVSRSIYMRIKRRVVENKFGPMDPGEKTMPPRVMSLASAAELLGVSRRAGGQELKQAYRRLMSRYHPDKMLARGCTQEELDLATAQVQEIKRAYDLMGKTRKLA
jgi:DnaJ like chaperone protein